MQCEGLAMRRSVAAVVLCIALMCTAVLMAVLGWRAAAADHRLTWCTIQDAELVASPYEEALQRVGARYHHERVVMARQRAVADINAWRELLRLALSPKPLGALAQSDYFRECMESDDYFRAYADPLCTYIWAKKMQYDNVVAVNGKMEPVMTEASRNIGVEKEKPGENGGIPLVLEDGSRAWFKPCYSSPEALSHWWLAPPGNGETYRAELFSFWLDRILGLNRTPVAMLRTLSLDHLRAMVAKIEDDDVRRHNEGALESIAVYCSVDDGTRVEGSMIGWSPFPVETIFKKKLNGFFDPFLMTREVLHRHYSTITQHSSATSKRDVLESMTGMFFINLIDNPGKVGHNMVFAHRRETLSAGELLRNAASADHSDAFADTNYGPLVLIDNDRARFTRTVDEQAMCTSGAPTTFIDVCRFPRSIAQRVLALGFNASASREALSEQEGRELGEEEAPRIMPPCTPCAPPEVSHECPSGVHADPSGHVPVYPSASLGSMLVALASRAAPGGVTANGPILTCREGYVADVRLQHWYNMLTRCIALHGEETVLIEEPWEQAYDMEDALALIRAS